MALKYIKLLEFEIILALKNSDKNAAISIKAKKFLIKRLAISKSLFNIFKLLVIFQKIAYIKITQKIIAQVLTIQAAINVPN